MQLLQIDIGEYESNIPMEDKLYRAYRLTIDGIPLGIDWDVSHLKDDAKELSYNAIISSLQEGFPEAFSKFKEAIKLFNKILDQLEDESNAIT